VKTAISKEQFGENPMPNKGRSNVLNAATLICSIYKLLEQSSAPVSYRFSQ